MLKLYKVLHYYNNMLIFVSLIKISINLLIVIIMACGGKKGGGKRPPKK